MGSLYLLKLLGIDSICWLCFRMCREKREIVFPVPSEEFWLRTLDRIQYHFLAESINLNYLNSGRRSDSTRNCISQVMKFS